MQIISTLEELNESLKPIWEDDNQLTAFIPTMGALHDGHLSLIRKAQEISQVSIASIFVNPLQFGPNEDLSKYPRSYEEDIIKLLDVGVNFLYYPDFNAEYLQSIQTLTANPSLTSFLCGRSRPGHFDGVCTIVNHFFELIKPDFAIFGEKDYQQLKIIEDMISSQAMNVQLIGSEIIREADGLAMSSRNSYLSPEERNLAPKIYQTLKHAQELKANTEEKLIYVEQTLTEYGFKIDYIESHWSRLFVALYLGETRLIDNIKL